MSKATWKDVFCAAKVNVKDTARLVANEGRFVKNESAPVAMKVMVGYHDLIEKANAPLVENHADYALPLRNVEVELLEAKLAAAKKQAAKTVAKKVAVRKAEQTVNAQAAPAPVFESQVVDADYAAMA